LAQPVPYGTIDQLYILPEFRNKGIGTRVLHEAERYFISRGAKKARLTVSVSNQVAVDLYNREGFAPERMILSKLLHPGKTTLSKPLDQ